MKESRWMPRPFGNFSVFMHCELLHYVFTSGEEGGVIEAYAKIQQ